MEREGEGGGGEGGGEVEREGREGSGGEGGGERKGRGREMEMDSHSIADKSTASNYPTVPPPPPQVLAAATVIAKHTSVLCNACKVASSKTSNPVAKRHFVQAAKEVANSTANLVKNIKVYV